MVLPFLLIGKALKPLAKIKKKAWSAMGNAFGQIRKSVDPMKSFSKIMEILNVVMLPLTYIFTILAYVILKELMPYISDLIDLLDDLEEALEDVGEATANAIDDLAAWTDTWWPALYKTLEELDEIIWKADDSIALIILISELFLQFLEDVMDAITELQQGIGGTPIGPDIFDLFPTPIIPMGGTPLNSSILNTSSTSNTVNINLQGSIIDNRDKLIRDITEQVIIRIG